MRERPKAGLSLIATTLLAVAFAADAHAQAMRPPRELSPADGSFDTADALRAAPAGARSLIGGDADAAATVAADGLLGRPLSRIELSGAPAREVAAKSERLKPQNRIQDLTGAAGTPVWVAGDAGERFSPIGFTWAAPAVYHRPLLFEQPNLERYGHYHGVCEGDNVTPSLLSGAHFFGATPALPYWMGAYGVCERQYTLGAYRPGSCNPHRLVSPRASATGLALQGAATTGLVFLVP